MEIKKSLAPERYNKAQSWTRAPLAGFEVTTEGHIIISLSRGPRIFEPVAFKERPPPRAPFDRQEQLFGYAGQHLWKIARYCSGFRFPGRVRLRYGVVSDPDMQYCSGFRFPGRVRLPKPYRRALLLGLF